MKDNERLLQVISEQEADLRQLRHQLSRAEALAAKRELQATTLHTLNLSMFSMLEQEQVYRLVTECLVYRLGWDVAIALRLHERRPVIMASYHATDQQLGHISDYLGQAMVFTEAYAHRQALSTLSGQDDAALAMRTLFQAEEVVAMPVQFGDQLYGYLVVCAQTEKGRRHGADDIDFLATISTLVGHAIQNGSSFQNLEEQNARLRHLDELKNSFISVTSHQLRTPLSIIKWILATLQGDAALEGMTEQKTMIGQAYETNERLIHVVNDLLNLSRIEDGHLPYNPQLTDLRSLLENVAAGTRDICANRGISMEAEIAPDLPPVELDPILFREAVQNLLDNAVDYNRQNGYVRLRAVQRDGGLAITVVNSGPGIPADQLPHIFDQFYRSPEAVKIQPNGNGLGLFLSRAIIREHGGDVACTASSPDGETVFTITFPL